jgi:hypothetical protein
MNDNPFREMAQAMRSRTGFDGTMLLFKKEIGWKAGKDAVDMNDEELVALVDQLMFGWCKWKDNKPVDYHVGLVCDRFKPPKRGELGDNDSTRWERRNKDPWQFTFFLPLADPETAALYVFSTTSAGGKDALADLQEIYADGRERQENAGKAPRVALQAEHYNHQEYGLVYKPRFAIVDWAAPPAIKPIRPPASQTIEHVDAPKLEHRPRRGELDDDIPF